MWCGISYFRVSLLTMCSRCKWYALFIEEVVLFRTPNSRCSFIYLFFQLYFTQKSVKYDSILCRLCPNLFSWSSYVHLWLCTGSIGLLSLSTCHLYPQNASIDLTAVILVLSFVWGWRISDVRFLLQQANVSETFLFQWRKKRMRRLKRKRRKMRARSK